MASWLLPYRESGLPNNGCTGVTESFSDSTRQTVCHLSECDLNSFLVLWTAHSGRF